MRRTVIVSLVGSAALGLAALALLLAFASRGTSAQPAEVDVGIELIGFNLEQEVDPSLGPEIGIVKIERITHSVPVGQVLHFQWFPPPGTTWHCNRANVPLSEGENVECTISALAPGASGGPATAQADCDTLPVPFTFDPEINKCKRIVPNSTIVKVVPPTTGLINRCTITEGPGGHPIPYVISDCDLDYEKTLPAGTPPGPDPGPGIPNFQQHQPWKKVVNESDPGTHSYVECAVIQPEPGFVDPNQANNESCLTIIIPQPDDGVGGIAFVDSSGSPASPADGSGSSVGLYAALAGALAAGVFAITASGWYARSRWLR